MNTITNTTVRTLGVAFAALILLAIPFAVAPKAHAADLFGDSGSSYDYSYPIDTGSSYDYSYPVDTSSSYDYSYPTDYSTPSYTDYSTPYYSSPSYGYGGSSYMPSYMPSSGGMSQAQSQSSTNVNVNTNTCTAGSCNTAINAPTNIVTNPTPVVINNTPSTPSYQPVYYPQPQPVYQPTYQPYQQPIAYNRPAPYISLAAVPYTGLDLGPTGTALYWGFLILWCLGAAYLIVVKRVQNKLVSGLNRFLFGSTAQTHSVAHAHPVHAPVAKATTPVAPQFSGIDPFIASQISRAAF